MQRFLILIIFESYKLNDEKSLCLIKAGYSKNIFFQVLNEIAISFNKPFTHYTYISVIKLQNDNLIYPQTSEQILCKNTCFYFYFLIFLSFVTKMNYEL